MSLRKTVTVLLPLGALLLAGCGEIIENEYGRVRGKSVNGTGVLANVLRSDGHTVRTAIRLTDELAEWADVIIRFAPQAGPPERDEAKWYIDWLSEQSGRRMVYIPRDYDATSEYWKDVVDHLSNDPELKARAERHRNNASKFGRSPVPKAKEVADAADWFAVDTSQKNPQVCKKLGGPWAEGVDPDEAALTRHETLKVESETVLLEGDGYPLAIEWNRFNGSQVLVVANGSFLLNATLVNLARRPLAWRVAQWVGEAPLNVAFVEGWYVVGDQPAAPSLFTLLQVPPFGWVAAQLLVLGLAACLARAPRLGRARPDPPSGEDRPVAHPEALGTLLARTKQVDDARAILDAYRRWRSPSHYSRVGLSLAPDDPTEKTSNTEFPPNE